MGHLPRYTFFFLFVPLILFPQGSVFAASENIILSEILIGKEKAQDSHEFIELYNPNSTPVDLSGFRLRYKNSVGTEDSISVIKSGNCIPGHGFFLWANSNGEYKSLADVTTSRTLTEKYTVLLYGPESFGNTPLDSFAWGNATTPPEPPVRLSLTRNLSDFSWFAERMTPTPTKSTPCPEPEPPVPVITSVRLNELLPTPGKTDTGEFIELYNDSDIEADISGFSLHDASQTGEYVFPGSTVVPPRGYFVIPSSVSKIALNNSNETLSFFDNTHALIDSMNYKTGREGVSLNFTKTDWRGGTPTPGALNQPNTLPETHEKVPKKGYRDMPVSFDARGKDQDGGTLKYTWDFGDDHKSYKEETEHTYEENGSYQVTLTTNDGKDDVVETFTIKIESFPKLDIRITALSPNPTGSDSKHEWLLIENREKESIDLKDFSIATGWDKLVNHPIRKSFVIKGKSSATLTREFSLFTLPNKRGRIELRSPNGKTMQEIEYKEKESIDEDMVYRKEKGKRWAWKNEKIALPKPVESSEAEPLSPEEATTITPESALEEIKSTDPQVASTQTIDQEALRKEFFRLLHHHAWVDISNTSPSSQPVTPTNFKNLLAKTNSLLNNWQNKK